MRDLLTGEGERTPSNCDRVEEEAVACELCVEPTRVLGEAGEAIVAGGEADTGADRGDVVQMAPKTLQLEQDRAAARKFARRGEPKRVFPGVRVGEAVGDDAAGAGSLGEGEAAFGPVPLGGSFEAAVLVEEPGVEVEDAIPDDVEAKVARLDDAGVDRPDRDLVGVVALHGDGPAPEPRIVVDQRSHRLVAVEAD